MKIVERLSDKFNDRSGCTKPELVIIHATGGKDFEWAMNVLYDPKREASTHYIIQEDGTIYRMVDEEKRAWHAGTPSSKWQGKEDINSLSIGIELSNRHAEQMEKYSDAQLNSLVELCQHFKNKYDLPAKAFVGHSDISPQRADKVDPNYHFPWKTMAEHGIGVWPKVTLKDKFNGVAVIKNENKMTNLLEKIGYNSKIFKDGTVATYKQLITAFQRHFEPEVFNSKNKKLVGKPTFKTAAKLNSLVRMSGN